MLITPVIPKIPAIMAITRKIIARFIIILLLMLLVPVVKFQLNTRLKLSLFWCIAGDALISPADKNLPVFYF